MTGLARVRHLLRGPKPAATNSQSECGMPQSPRARTAPSGAAAPPRRRSILKGPGRVALVAARVAFVAMAGFSAAYLTGAPGESTALRGAQTPVGDARALSEVPVTQTYADLTGHAGDASVVAEGERGWVAAARRRLSTASCDYTEDELSTPFVIIYTVVLLYALLGLAIVCDDFFVAALERISEVLNLSEDVAGATFMAAGSSAPELFTSTVDVFIFQSNVGIGTIVGSAVFNILVIIAMSATASSEALKIDWRPMTRDCLFYCASIALLLGFSTSGNEIVWWESMLLVLLYCAYVAFMAVNRQIMHWIGVKTGMEPSDEVIAADQAAAEAAALEAIEARQLELASQKKLHSKQLARRRWKVAYHVVSVATLEMPRLLHELRERRQLWAAACEELPPPSTTIAPALRRFRVAVTSVRLACVTFPKLARRVQAAHEAEVAAETGERVMQELYEAKAVADVRGGHGAVRDDAQEDDEFSSHRTDPSPRLALHDIHLAEHDRRVGVGSVESPRSESTHSADGDEQPSTVDKAYNALAAPWVLFFTYTIPNCAEERWQKWYVLTFIMSVLMIGVISWVLVDQATRLGCAVGLDPVVMGLTVLAAGTSIPDALGSMVVARDGMGDMAVANAIGSNVFDICLGIGLPYFIMTAFVDPGSAIPIRTGSVEEPIIVLLTTLVVTYGSFMINKWLLTRRIGYMLLVMYGVFVLYSLLRNAGADEPQ